MLRCARSGIGYRGFSSGTWESVGQVEEASAEGLLFVVGEVGQEVLQGVEGAVAVGVP
jgi:hypothetical protein